MVVIQYSVLVTEKNLGSDTQKQFQKASAILNICSKIIFSIFCILAFLMKLQNKEVLATLASKMLATHWCFFEINSQKNPIFLKKR